MKVIGRCAELVALFVVTPMAVAVAPAWAVVPAILGGAAVCGTLLHLDRTFERSTLCFGPSRSVNLRGVTGRALVAMAVIALMVSVYAPRQWFVLPLRRPGLWMTLMIAYPVVSVYPQELIFRAFFFHRYRALLRTPRARIIASAAAFAHAHLVLHNRLALVATGLAGLVLGWLFERHPSVLRVSLEHAFWGCMAFTMGLETFFYAGSP